MLAFLVFMFKLGLLNGLVKGMYKTYDEAVRVEVPYTWRTTFLLPAAVKAVGHQGYRLGDGRGPSLGGGVTGWDQVYLIRIFTMADACISQM